MSSLVLHLHYFIQFLHYNDGTKYRKTKKFELLHPSSFANIRKENATIHLQKKLEGNVEDRIKLRKIILNKFQNHDPDSDGYKMIISELADFEESLIKKQ